MVDDQNLLKFYVGLTTRQREVLQLVSLGLTNQETANRLCIAPSVVAGHLTNIYGELDNMEGMERVRANRYSVIRLFAHFFLQYPELDNF
ncbi:MAG: helix-turn-helix transcriptional regulator [Anaerolineae bacterium]|nr:helix-turn-helix transcriptional regulator [Anaerolineae bacterium]